MSVRVLLSGLLLCVLAPAPAPAQEHPPFLPTRDFAATYRVGQSQQALGYTLRVNFSAHGDRFRAEAGDQAGWIILNPDQHSTMLVLPQTRMFMELPFDPAKAERFLLNDSMTFTRRGADRVAGFPCTIWDVRSKGVSGQMCMTGDGVILRGSSNRGAIEATKLEYARQPDELFAPPRDFHRLEAPAGALLWRGLLPEPG